MNSPSDTPEIVPAEQFSDLVDSYQRSGHHVSLVTAAPPQSLDALALALGCNVADLYKTVCLNYKEDGGRRVLVSVVVPAAARVDAAKVSSALGVPAQKLKSAQPDFIAQETGFVPGGIPPFGYEGRRLVDQSIFNRQVAYAGGGNNLHAYSRFAPAFLVFAHPDAIVGDFQQVQGI